MLFRSWIRFQLNDCLRGLGGACRRRRDRGALDVDDTERFRHASAHESATRPASAAFASSASPLRPPSDTHWRRVDDFDAIVFSRRGRFDAASFGTLLFVNLFWNGIVSVFIFALFSGDVDAPQGMSWWGMFVFLIPFEIIGLGMFLALLAAFLEPVRRITWRIGHHSIQKRLTWAGVGPRWTWWIDRLDRLEVHDEQGTARLVDLGVGAEKTRRVPSGEGQFKLCFVDDQNAVLCGIDRLSHGEARWMTDAVLRERPEWAR